MDGRSTTSSLAGAIQQWWYALARQSGYEGRKGKKTMVEEALEHLGVSNYTRMAHETAARRMRGAVWIHVHVGAARNRTRC